MGHLHMTVDANSEEAVSLWNLFFKKELIFIMRKCCLAQGNALFIHFKGFFFLLLCFQTQNKLCAWVRCHHAYWKTAVGSGIGLSVVMEFEVPLAQDCDTLSAHAVAAPAPSRSRPRSKKKREKNKEQKSQAWNKTSAAFGGRGKDQGMFL